MRIGEREQRRKQLARELGEPVARRRRDHAGRADTHALVAAAHDETALVRLFDRGAVGEPGVDERAVGGAAHPQRAPEQRLRILLIAMTDELHALSSSRLVPRPMRDEDQRSMVSTPGARHYAPTCGKRRGDAGAGARRSSASWLNLSIVRVSQRW